MRSGFLGTGCSLPDRIVTNDDIAARGLETSDEWIRTRTGIRERRVLEDGRATSDMAAEAARAACDAAGITPDEIDCLIVATATPDMPMPSCAVMTQQKLGARCPAFDVNAACAGFSHGLVVADGLIRAGIYRRVLFIGAEALTRFLDWDDRGTCILFGDGAGAVVMGPVDEADRGLLATHLGSDGRLWGDLNILGGGTLHGVSPDTLAKNLHVLRMNGRVVFSHAVRHLSEACEAVLDAAGVGIDEVDVIIPHQANLRIIDAVAKRLAAPKDRFVVNIARYGNTSAASIPIALDESVRAGKVSPGSLLLMCGLGAGLTWGAALARW